VDEGAGNHSLSKCHAERAEAECCVPIWFGHDAASPAKFEGGAPDREGNQHDDEGEIKRCQQCAERDGKQGERATSGEDQPGFVRIPHREYGDGHGVAVIGVAKQTEEHSHAEIGPVQQNVGEQHEPDGEGGQEGQEAAGGQDDLVHQVSPLPGRA
jgi:hypothetical protein